VGVNWRVQRLHAPSLSLPGEGRSRPSSTGYAGEGTTWHEPSYRSAEIVQLSKSAKTGYCGSHRFTATSSPISKLIKSSPITSGPS